MKYYALILKVDKTSNQRYEALHKILKENNITDYGDDHFMHLTIADYYGIDEEKIMTQLDDHYKDLSAFSVGVNQIGMFLNTNIIYFAPTQTNALRQFHQDHHQTFASYLDEHSLYGVASWIPHFTIASRIEDMSQALDHCINHLAFEVEFKTLTLFEIVYVDEIPVGERLIWEKQL